jgi:hypothetical protein
MTEEIYERHEAAGGRRCTCHGTSHCTYSKLLQEASIPVPPALAGHRRPPPAGGLLMLFF